MAGLDVDRWGACHREINPSGKEACKKRVDGSWKLAARSFNLHRGPAIRINKYQIQICRHTRVLRASPAPWNPVCDSSLVTADRVVPKGRAKRADRHLSFPRGDCARSLDSNELFYSTAAGAQSMPFASRFKVHLAEVMANHRSPGVVRRFERR